MFRQVSSTGKVNVNSINQHDTVMDMISAYDRYADGMGGGTYFHEILMIVW
jgi:hypothetical protein